MTATDLRTWLLSGLNETAQHHDGPHAQPGEKPHAWWKVMCLTGVDYFSTLGYQPGIAALARFTQHVCKVGCHVERTVHFDGRP